MPGKYGHLEKWSRFSLSGHKNCRVRWSDRILGFEVFDAYVSACKICMHVQLARDSHNFVNDGLLRNTRVKTQDQLIKAILCVNQKRISNSRCRLANGDRAPAMRMS